MHQYDYIIAGAGAAGLSLAYHLNQTVLREKSILLIDKANKDRNDRTWCFWEAGENPFEPVVYRQWSSAYFYGTDFQALLDLSPYRYKMIRGIDFYRFVQSDLEQNSNITWLYSTILSIEEAGEGARVATEQGTYSAKWVFDSTYLPQLRLPHRHHLLQHFKGWEIKTRQPVFDPNQATLMDFRIEQKGEARFFYVLPSEPDRALVEFTIFSESLLAPAEYEIELRNYLANFLQLAEYQVLHEEFGVIPMTDEKLSNNPSAHVLRMGTAGGDTKPSTGYTFLRIQANTQAIVKALLRTGKPFYPSKPRQTRFGFYDSVLLNVIQARRCQAKDVFTHLFKKNSPASVLKFLDEATTLTEELRIMASVPSFPFLAAVLDVSRKRLLENPIND